MSESPNVILFTEADQQVLSGILFKNVWSFLSRHYTPLKAQEHIMTMIILLIIQICTTCAVRKERC